MKNKDTFISELSRKQLVELDACTQCGECLSVCPVQEVTGDPSISPPEKIRMFKEFIRSTDSLKATLLGSDKISREKLEHFVKAVYECTTCGACGESCTVGIHTQRLWPTLRREMVRRGLGPIGGQAQMPEVTRKTGNVYNYPANERFAPWFPSGINVPERSDIAYYAGCTGAYDATPMVKGDVLVLAATDTKFTMLPAEDEVCCGFPLFITGQHEILEELVRKLVDGYAARGVKTLLCSCPCCVNMMTRDWPLYYGRKLPFRIRHISQHIMETINSGRLEIKRSLEQRLIYHDPCYLSRGVGITEEPREVLKSIPGIELLEYERNRANSRCCGSGGAARKVFAENATAIARLTIDEAVEKKADRLMLGCPACYGKVNEAMQEHDKQIQITDVMELIAELIK
jgi:heterodisulfide reductase subunit D